MNPLERIISDTGSQQLAEEIKEAIQNGMAFLFVRDNDGFVLKPVIENGVTGVIVWIGWGSGNAPERHLPEVKKLARDIGARWLRFHSPRKGWLRVAPRLGWIRQPNDADGFFVFQIKL